MKASVKRKARHSMADKAKATKVAMLKVKSGFKYRGARAAWYEVLQEHDGKPVEEFIESTRKKPPSLTGKGEAEAPAGWLRFFQRVGAASVHNA